MKIYADPITVNCKKVLAGLDLIGAPYELVYVDFFKGQHKEEPYISLNPNASVPAMVDGDLVLWESNAILQYASDKVGNQAVYPKDLQARADINRWLLWESSSWFPACYVYIVENCVKPLLGGSPDAAVLKAQDDQFHKLAGILNQRLAQQEWIAGDQVTIADIALAAPMHLHGWARLPLDQHQHVRRWITNSIEALPCWKKTTIYEGFTTQKPKEDSE